MWVVSPFSCSNVQACSRSRVSSNLALCGPATYGQLTSWRQHTTQTSHGLHALLARIWLLTRCGFHVTCLQLTSCQGVCELFLGTLQSFLQPTRLPGSQERCNMEQKVQPLQMGYAFSLVKLAPVTQIVMVCAKQIAHGCYSIPNLKLCRRESAWPTWSRTASLCQFHPASSTQLSTSA